MSIAIPVAPIDDGVPWTLSDIAKAVMSAGAFLIGLLLITNLAVLGFGLQRRVSSELEVVAGIAVELSLLGAAWRFSLWKYRRPWRDLGFRPFVPRALLLAGVVLILGLAVNVAYVVLISLAGLTQLLPPTLPAAWGRDGLAWAGMFLLAVVASPLGEETFFRGFIFEGVRRRFGLGWGVGASGLLFALAHFQVGVFIPVGILGAMLAVLYQSTGSLWPAIAVHSLYNGLALQLAFT